MTTIVKAGLSVVVGSSILAAGANQMKLYEVKSGKITYEIKGSGEIMGSKIQTIGKKRVVFDSNGAKNLTEENKIEKQTIMGQKKITKTHTMTYMKKGMVYNVSFDKRRIMRMGNMSMAMGVLMGGGQNMTQSGEEIMKKMGAKKIGTDKVLGYTCDVWDMMGTKQCMYKGIPLRVEMDVMGIKNTEVATKAEFDISLSNDDFKLPEFPIYDMEGNRLDRSKLDAMDERAGLKAEQIGKEVSEMRSAMAVAAKDAGIKEGQRPNKTQEKEMADSMMEAMLPRIKQKALAEGKALRFGKECFSNADILKEANECSHKMDAMAGEISDPEDDFREWNIKTKNETLKFIEQGLKGIVCVQKAQSMQDMKQCMQ